MHHAPKIFHDNLTEAFTLHSCRLFWVSLWRQSCCQFLTLNTSIRIDDVRQSGIFFSPLEAGTLEQAIENQWSSVFGIEPCPNGSLTHCCCKSLPQAEIKFLKPAGLRGQKIYLIERDFLSRKAQSLMTSQKGITSFGFSFSLSLSDFSEWMNQSFTQLNSSALCLDSAAHQLSAGT